MKITFTLDASIVSSGDYPYEGKLYKETRSFSVDPIEGSVIPIGKNTKTMIFKAQNAGLKKISVVALIDIKGTLIGSKGNKSGRKTLKYSNLDFTSDAGETETFLLLVEDSTNLYCLDPQMKVNT